MTLPPDLAGGWLVSLLDLGTGILVGVGAFFFLAGTVGLLRFPDLYCRLHALTKADTLGLGFITAGLVLQLPGWNAGLQLLLIWVLALSAAATVCHLLASASLQAGIRPVEGADEEGEGP
jgi:multicomponent Na+:H+ antiporter subunit G